MKTFIRSCRLLTFADDISINHEANILNNDG